MHVRGNLVPFFSPLLARGCNFSATVLVSSPTKQAQTHIPGNIGTTFQQAIIP
jgi:hypothetical protein